MIQWTAHSPVAFDRGNAPSHQRVCYAARCRLQPLVADTDSSGNCLLQGFLYRIGDPLQHKGIQPVKHCPVVHACEAAHACLSARR